MKIGPDINKTVVNSKIFPRHHAWSDGEKLWEIAFSSATEQWSVESSVLFSSKGCRKCLSISSVLWSDDEILVERKYSRKLFSGRNPLFTAIHVARWFVMFAGIKYTLNEKNEGVNKSKSIYKPAYHFSVKFSWTGPKELEVRCQCDSGGVFEILFFWCQYKYL